VAFATLATPGYAPVKLGSDGPVPLECQAWQTHAWASLPNLIAVGQTNPLE